jgi:hypothetical protein
MATTTADLVSETRRHLLSGTRDEMNRIDGAISSSVTTLTFEFAAGSIATGAMLSVEFEEIYVWSVSGQVATVQRAQLGSAGATHADDILIRVNALFSDWAIYRALAEELQSLSSPLNGLYRARTVDLTYAAGTQGYNLTSVTDFQGVLNLAWKSYTNGEWPEIRRYRIAQDMATAEFASGKALILYEGAGPGRTIHLIYKAPYAALATTSTDVATDTGLHAEAHDILPLGAAARLVAAREVKRAFTESQPESRDAADVPPGTARGAAQLLLALRNQRIREESTRLSAHHPTYARI